MLGGSHGKIMGAGEIFLGAHIEVIMLGVVQHAFQSLIRGNTDGTWRKSGIFIGVIGMGATGAFSLFFEKDAAYTEIGSSSSSVDNSFGGIDTVDFSEIKNFM